MTPEARLLLQHLIDEHGEEYVGEATVDDLGDLEWLQGCHKSFHGGSVPEDV